MSDKFDVAIIGGGVLVSLANVLLFAGVDGMSEAEKVDTYVLIYGLALMIPVVSVLGVVLAGVLRRRDLRRLHRQGIDRAEARRLVFSVEIPLAVANNPRNSLAIALDRSAGRSSNSRVWVPDSSSIETDIL